MKRYITFISVIISLNFTIVGCLQSSNQSDTYENKITYYDTGEKESEFYLDDNNLHHGEFKVWYKNGKLSALWNFEHGKKHGLCEMWWENDSIMSRKSYEHGVPVGEWNVYGINGNLIKTQQWDMGKLVYENMVKPEFLWTRGDIPHFISPILTTEYRNYDINNYKELSEALKSKFDKDYQLKVLEFTLSKNGEVSDFNITGVSKQEVKDIEKKIADLKWVSAKNLDGSKANYRFHFKW